MSDYNGANAPGVVSVLCNVASVSVGDRDHVARRDLSGVGFAERDAADIGKKRIVVVIFVIVKDHR